MGMRAFLCIDAAELENLTRNFLRVCQSLALTTGFGSSPRAVLSRWTRDSIERRMRTSGRRAEGHDWSGHQMLSSRTAGH